MIHVLRATVCALILWSVTASAAETQVAVAANFTAPAKEIAAAFQSDTGNTAVLSYGASGTFYAQIVNGAPFAALLSADAERPRKLEADGIGRRGSRFVYAIGRLVLWSSNPRLVDDRGEVLRSGNFRKLALANPKAAPYGEAAIEVLNKLGVWDAVKDKVVRGENIAQTHQFVATANAELGFVALSQVVLQDTGSKWVVPQNLHSPIEQEAVLVKDDPVAKAFLDYLKSPKAVEIIRKYGYAAPGS